MPTCKDAARLLAQDEMGASRGERVGLRVHLLMCRFCRRYKAQLGALGEGCREQFGAAADEDPEVLANLERSILKGDRE
jgi:hypothetical protein